MKRWLGIVTMAAAVLLAGCTADKPQQQPGRDERVAKYFTNTAKDIATKENISAAPVTYLPAGQQIAKDGTEFSLWVSDPSDPTKIRSHCYYLDEQQPDGGAGGYGGCGALDGRDISLGGDSKLAVGSIGEWDAASVRITGNGTTETIPITAGYFLVPLTFTVDVDEPLTLTLIDKSGAELGTVTGLTPPGSAELVPSPR